MAQSLEGHEIQFIVERLNEAPFNMQLTMVAFDEKSPFELLEIVNELMAQLSSVHRTDLRDETPEATANRMLEFLRVLNYKTVRSSPAALSLPLSLRSPLRAVLPHPLHQSLLSATAHRSPLAPPQPPRSTPHAHPLARRTWSRSRRSSRCCTATRR